MNIKGLHEIPHAGPFVLSQWKIPSANHFAGITFFSFLFWMPLVSMRMN